MVDCAKGIFRNNFKVREGDRILLFYDEISAKRIPSVISAFMEAIGDLDLPFFSVCIKNTGSHGAEPPIELWELLFGRNFVGVLEDTGLMERVLAKELRDSILDEFIPLCNLRYNVIVALTYYSTTHTIFRKVATSCGARYASMPLFEEYMLCGSCAVNVEELKELTKRVADYMNRADYATISAPNGTFMELSLEGRLTKEDDGDLSEPGSYGNLPAGEAFIAPVEGLSKGILVVEYAGDKRLESPLELKIDEGEVIEMNPMDHPFTEFLREVFVRYPHARNVAELGVGTNGRAKNPVNVLEAEKILGTVHIALGDNAGFGGKVRVPFHMDFVIFEPTLKLRIDGEWKTLIENGKLKV